jgi:hypothetical protein
MESRFFVVCWLDKLSSVLDASLQRRSLCVMIKSYLINGIFTLTSGISVENNHSACHRKCDLLQQVLSLHLQLFG